MIVILESIWFTQVFDLLINTSIPISTEYDYVSYSDSSKHALNDTHLIHDGCVPLDVNNLF